MSHAGMNKMSAGIEHSFWNQGAGIRLELQPVTVPNLLCSMVALTLALAALTPLGRDSVWVAPVAGLAAVAIQFMTPASEFEDAASGDFQG